MIRHTLTLDYDLAPGWLQPFVAGLADGRAVARRCERCDRVSFMPLPVCDCGETRGNWIDLPGTATIDRRTEGADGAFGLVRFDGADTRTVARLEGFGSHDRRGTLVRPPSELPAIVLRPLSGEVAA